jgi:hypothetical protein
MRLGFGFGKDASEAAQRLAIIIVDSLPPEVEGATTDRGRAIRKKAVEGILRAATKIAQDQPMNLLQRIAFGRAFQAKLVSAGYSDDFIRQVTTAVMAELTLPGHDGRSKL